MKRTQNSGDQNRDFVFRFRVSPEEKKLVKKAAQENGLTVSEYVRKQLNRLELSGSLDRHTLLRYHAELNKEGSNLNQIARVLNTQALEGKVIDIDHHLFNTTLININNLTSHIIELLKNVCIRKTKR